jgi:hypothetical protein
MQHPFRSVKILNPLLLGASPIFGLVRDTPMLKRKEERAAINDDVVRFERSVE